MSNAYNMSNIVKGVKKLVYKITDFRDIQLTEDKTDYMNEISRLFMQKIKSHPEKEILQARWDQTIRLQAMGEVLINTSYWLNFEDACKVVNDKKLTPEDALNYIRESIITVDREIGRNELDIIIAKEKDKDKAKAVNSTRESR